MLHLDCGLVELELVTLKTPSHTSIKYQETNHNSSADDTSQN